MMRNDSFGKISLSIAGGRKSSRAFDVLAMDDIIARVRPARRVISVGRFLNSFNAIRCLLDPQLEGCLATLSGILRFDLSVPFGSTDSRILYQLEAARSPRGVPSASTQFGHEAHPNQIESGLKLRSARSLRFHDS